MAQLNKSSNPQHRDYASIMPKKGWPRRNYHFLRKRILPQILKKRHGESKPPIPAPPADGKIRVTWIGHASFLVQFPNHSVIIDPNWANWHGVVKRQREPGLDLTRMPQVDLVMVTHAHFDHLHKKSLKILESHKGIVVPQGSGSLVKKLGFSQVYEMAVWDDLKLEDLTITHTPSHHWGARYLHDTHRDYGGYVVSSGICKVFHCGDSAYFEGFKEIGKRHTPDVALMPIGAYDTPSGRDVHMNPEEAIRAFIEMEAGILIPMHYGTFPLGNEPYHEPVERLMKEAERLGVADRVLIPEEGIGIEVQCLAEAKA